MKESGRNLNMLRDAMLARRAAGETVQLPEQEGDAINTLERFEALPMEEQLARMRAKEYDDLELFKQKHYGKGREVRVDINELRKLTDMAPVGAELKAAELKFLQKGLPCEVVSRGEGLEPWLKLALPTGDVYVAHQYNRIVATDRIPGFNTSTAGLGEFEYYVEV